ncbi:hypothetical protein E3N88_19973 [Mikania micrantha]|uniref:Uncharacterized protein n=1 Tax=Mikania micrantha TaxID=192012 RepID=A0A5N6NFQ0_9ASTR|nr:hypothetical protein E3N88_19973 [Mikania micrantha]
MLPLPLEMTSSGVTGGGGVTGWYQSHRSGVETVRGWMVGLGNMRMELRLLDAAIVMAAVAIIITCLLYLLR